MKTKITVVIPTYKRPKLLIDCLTALSNQTLAKEAFEVIVVSDGPDEKTLKHLNPWLNAGTLSIKYLHTSVKKGPAAARNLGWRSASTPLIAFTDDDCSPCPTWLETFVKHYNGELYIAFSGFTNVPISNKPTDYELNISNLRTAEFITANCACSYLALSKVQGFDERFEAAWREDSDLEFKFITHHIPILKIKEATIVHPVRQAPWGISIKEQKKGIYDALLFKKFPSLYRKNIQSEPLWNYYMINILWMLIIISLAFQKTNLITPLLILQFILFSSFIYRRLQFSRKTISHTLEMIGTSLLIPSLSIYWRIYGNIKFRALLI